jgi:hypothetical protein
MNMKKIRLAGFLLVALISMAVASSLLIPGDTAEPDDVETPTLNEHNFRSVLKHVLPSEQELRWEQIGWRTDLMSGLREARALERPLLLWTMNGHPLGHT